MTPSRRSGVDSQHVDMRLRSFFSGWSPALVNVVGLLVLLFLLGGSSRADVWSLPILRPIAILSLFYGLWSLSRKDIARYRFLLIGSVTVTLLVMLHLIPLPPFIWTAFSGRGIVVAVDAAAGLSGTWRPISMASEYTWNALFALSIPLAILTNGVKLSAAQHRKVLLVLLLGGFATLMLGVLQIGAGLDTSLYFYRFSNFGSPVGLFANRNHQALFIAAMLPLLGFLIATEAGTARVRQTKRILAFAGIMTIIAFLIILGSRAGLVTGLIGLASLALIAMRPDRRGSANLRSHRLKIGAFALAAIGVMVALAMSIGNAESIRRVLHGDNGDELRYALWPIIMDALPGFLPWGTGIGTYERIFQTIEPDNILHVTYSNHAHNDWLEVAFTAGVPGILIMLASAMAFLVTAFRVSSLPAGAARGAGSMGLVIILMAAIGSVVDYPLRTPIISALFSISCLWAASSLCSSWDDIGTPARKSDF